ncbi:MAG TPA: hypothetical protein VLZ06_06975, partial [Solirubrobacteraceae bacterium]|nr:hypothetical protein [Solirubrobacteraceae bacterium]
MSADEVTAIATCAIALATTLGIGIAALGLKTWRAQLEGSAQFDLARRLLLEVYRLRDAVEGLRSPMMLKSEAAGANQEMPWEVAAYERRWQRILDAQAPLDVCLYEAQILWGDEVRGLAHQLAKQTRTLFLAVSAFARSKHAEGEALSDDQRDVLYAGMGKDTFKLELEDIVGRIEEYLRPHLPL